MAVNPAGDRLTCGRYAASYGTASAKTRRINTAAAACTARLPWPRYGPWPRRSASWLPNPYLPG